MTPLGDHLGEALDREELSIALVSVERRIQTRRRARRIAVASVALGCLLLAVGVWTRDSLQTVPTAAAEPRSVEAPSGEAQVAPLEEVETHAEGVSRFSDGSEVHADGRAQLVRVSSDEVVWAVESGRARFDVVPGGPRRWSVIAGELRVEVIGTAFTVARDEDGTRVTVHRGRVTVTAHGRTRELIAGEELTVGMAVPDDPSALSNEAGDTDRGAIASGREDRGPHPSVATVPEGPAPDEEGSGSAPIPDAEGTRLTSLVAAADSARRTGSDDEAITALSEIVEQYPGTADAPNAALTLGRLHSEHGRHRAAAEAYRRALGLSPPPALAELAYERLVSELVTLGERTEAREVAASYRQLFGRGASARAIDELVEP